MTRAGESAAPPSGPGHLYAADLVRVLTFACVIAVHTVTSINPPDSVPAGGAAMLLHFTREVFFVLTAFVLVHRYRERLRIAPFWRRRFRLVGLPYLLWSVIYSGLALIMVPLPPATALAQLGHNLITGTGWYHLYFLLVSMQFYLIFPLFLLLLRTSGRWHWWLLALSALLQAGIDAWLHTAHPDGLAGQLLPYAGSFVGSYPFYLVLGGVAALHADRVQAWVRGHRAMVIGAFVVTGVAAEGWYLRSVHGGASPMSASDVFQPVMVPWCLAVVAAFFALGVAWASRRGDGPGSRAVEIGSDRSFGVFLVHPMVLWALTLGASPWLPTQVPAPWSTVLAFVITVVVSLLLVEVLRRSPLSQVLTGKSRFPGNACVSASLIRVFRPGSAVPAGRGADVRSRS